MYSTACRDINAARLSKWTSSKSKAKTSFWICLYVLVTITLTVLLACGSKHVSYKSREIFIRDNVVALFYYFALSLSACGCDEVSRRRWRRSLLVVLWNRNVQRFLPDWSRDPHDACALRPDAIESLRQDGLRTHRVFSGRHRGGRLAVFWTTAMPSARSRRRVRQE